MTHEEVIQFAMDKLKWKRPKVLSCPSNWTESKYPKKK